MSLDKAIKHGKEKRKPYHKNHDKTCHPGGSCPYCKENRMHSTKKREGEIACPYGYDVAATSCSKCVADGKCQCGVK